MHLFQQIVRFSDFIHFLPRPARGGRRLDLSSRWPQAHEFAAVRDQINEPVRTDLNIPHTRHVEQDGLEQDYADPL